MYSKNPITGKLDSHAYKSDITKLITRVSLLKADGGDEQVDAVINQANSFIASATTANTEAATSVANAQESIVKSTGADGSKAKITRVVNNFNNTAISTIRAKAIGIETQTAELAEANTKNTNSLNTLLDCFVDTSERIADLDLLHEVGILANAANGEKYKASHCTNGAELNETGFAFVQEMNREESIDQERVSSNNLMSLSNLTGVNANIVQKWNGISLPSLTEGRDSSIYSSLQTFYGELPNLVKARGLFQFCASLTGFYTEAPAENETVGSGSLPNLQDGENMFTGCQNLTNWTVELPHLTNGVSMFQGCTKLTSWSVDLYKLEYASCMFNNAGLTSWDTDLTALQDGGSMFENCTSLTSWSGNLKNLVNGASMFANTALTEWNTPLPSLETGLSMFQNGPALVSCAIALPNLKYANAMFHGCTSLVDGPTSLPKLEDGTDMFSECFLSKESVVQILDSLQEWPEDGEQHSITIGANAAECLVEITPAGAYKYRRVTEIIEKIFEATNGKHWNVAEIYYDANHTRIPTSQIEPIPETL